MYPYLLRSMKVTRPSEVYAADIYVHPHGKGLLYLAVESTGTAESCSPRRHNPMWCYT